MELEKFVESTNPPENEFDKDLDKSLSLWTNQVRELLNGGLRIDENLNVSLKTLTTDATPGNETAVAHGLGRTPVGFMVVSKDKAGDIYDGSTAKDSTNLYVASDTASVTIKILIF